MSIIDDLKFAMIPTAWKDEKLYSAIPSETTQTQVFDVNEVQSQGGTPATYLQIDTVNEEFTVLAGSDFSYVFLTANDNRQFRGKEYTVNITYTENGNTQPVRLYGQNNLQTGDLVDGQNTKTFVMDGDQNGNDVRLRISVGNNTTDITFSNISISYKANGDFNFSRGSSATRIYSSGLLQTITDNDAPRLDYTGGGCPSVLLEPQRSNLMTYSEQPITNFGFSNTQNMTITQNATTSPDGSTNAMLVESTNTNSKLTVQDIDFVSGTTYTASVYVKNIDATIFNIFFYNASGTPSSTNIDKSSELSSEWTRIYATYTATANDTGINSQIQFARGLPSGESFYMWGFQVEEGSYPTSYIPTSGTTATRLSDSLTGTGNGLYLNDSEGVVYLEIAALANDGTYRYIILWGSGGRIRIFFNPLDNRLEAEYRTSFSTPADFSVNLDGTVDLTQNTKIAFKYKTNDYALWVNGTEVATDTTGATGTLNLDKIDFDDSFGGNKMYCRLKQFQCYDRALTDSEIISLTT